MQRIAHAQVQRAAPVFRAGMEEVFWRQFRRPPAHTNMSHDFGAANTAPACAACGIKREWAQAVCPAAATAPSAPIASTVAANVNTAPPAVPAQPGSFRAAHEAIVQSAKAIPPPSAEQQAIVEAVKRGSSLIVNSGARACKQNSRHLYVCPCAHSSLKSKRLAPFRP